MVLIGYVKIYKTCDIKKTVHWFVTPLFAYQNDCSIPVLWLPEIGLTADSMESMLTSIKETGDYSSEMDPVFKAGRPNDGEWDHLYINREYRTQRLKEGQPTESQGIAEA